MNNGKKTARTDGRTAGKTANTDRARLTTLERLRDTCREHGITLKRTGTGRVGTVEVAEFQARGSLAALVQVFGRGDVDAVVRDKALGIFYKGMRACVGMKTI